MPAAVQSSPESILAAHENRFANITLKPGEGYRVPDIPGIRLQTGNPQNLDVTVGGRPGRLPPAGYAGRLDAVLDPESLLAAAEGQK